MATGGHDSYVPVKNKGTALYEKYELPIEPFLGRGASGVVIRAVEKNTRCEYAAKVIDLTAKRNPFDIAKTKKETLREVSILKMCAGLPNIIGLQDVYETPTSIYLIMELCNQGDLFKYLDQNVYVSEERTRVFMHQLLDVVNHLHSRNIVHRDLKLENILLDDNLNIKVSDFGFATTLSEGEQLKEFLGTIYYIAPETWSVYMNDTNSTGYGMPVDLWACGVIMFNLLCGSQPFWHRRQERMIKAIKKRKYSFSSPLWKNVSTNAKDLISKLLVVDPKARYTAQQALSHPFFRTDLQPKTNTLTGLVFRASVSSVCCCFRRESEL